MMMVLFVLLLLGLNLAQYLLLQDALDQFLGSNQSEYFEGFLLLGVLHDWAVSIGAAAMFFATVKFATILRHDRTSTFGCAHHRGAAALFC